MPTAIEETTLNETEYIVEREYMVDDFIQMYEDQWQPKLE